MAWNQDFGAGANPGSTYEQQSWRDNFNGGRAAGDWTGNNNQRLDNERAAFQGGTWSGSSTQPSALELAQSMLGSGPALGHVSAGGGASSGVGPGNGVISTGLSVPTKGPGNRVVVVGGSAPLGTKIKDTATGGYAGLQVLPNPWFSDVEEWWEPRYGEPGEWLGGIVNIVADGLYTAARGADAGFGTRITTEQKGSGSGWSDWMERNLSQPNGQRASDAFERQFSTWDRHLHEMLNGSQPYVGGGF